MVIPSAGSAFRREYQHIVPDLRLLRCQLNYPALDRAAIALANGQRRRT
jgi:hypothetical protein